MVEDRQFLWGLCYRMLGNAADADDVVQETYLRSMEKPPLQTEEPMRPWLVRVAMNLARDQLRRRKREAYVGPWLPSPIETACSDELSPESRYGVLESVSFAFLLALEALTPVQRAVLLLRDVFDYSVAETMDALNLSESNVKTTHHRARRAMAVYDKRKVKPSGELQDRTTRALNALLGCLARRDTAGLQALLAADARAISDGGGEFFAARKPVIGREKIAAMYIKLTETGAKDARVEFRVINGGPALVASREGASDGSAPRWVFRIELNDSGEISTLHTVLATRKLTAIQPAA